MMSPIDNIKFFSDQMRNSATSNDFKEVDKYHKLIENQSKMALASMNDILDQGLINHGKFVANEGKFKPNHAVSQVAEILRHCIID